MTEFPLDSSQGSALPLTVLAAYRAEQTVRKQTDPEHEGWVDRLTTIAGIDDQQLSALHGQLIALGMLKFQLTSRKTGIQYQIGPAGNKALEKASATRTSGEFENDRDAA